MSWQVKLVEKVERKKQRKRKRNEKIIKLKTFKFSFRLAVIFSLIYLNLKSILRFLLNI